MVVPKSPMLHSKSQGLCVHSDILLKKNNNILLKKTLTSFITVYFAVITLVIVAGPRSAVGNVSGYRCVSDCRSRGRESDPSPVPYFRGD